MRSEGGDQKNPREAAATPATSLPDVLSLLSEMGIKRRSQNATLSARSGGRLHQQDDSAQNRERSFSLVTKRTSLWRGRSKTRAIKSAISRMVNISEILIPSAAVNRQLFAVGICTTRFVSKTFPRAVIANRCECRRALARGGFYLSTRNVHSSKMNARELLLIAQE